MIEVVFLFINSCRNKKSNRANKKKFKEKFKIKLKKTLFWHFLIDF